jgi:hypothetical protein
MSYFNFLRKLDEDLYQRYMMIEESVKSINSNVYLNMQIYLEHLFKFVSKRQGYNLHTKKKLGEILADYRIENYCLVKIEYDKINVLKTINHYGNKYKHNKILDFNFQQFMLLMQEIYIISIKIYNYYQHTKINQIIPLNSIYFQELMQQNNKVEIKLADLETDFNILTQELKEKERDINQLNEDNERLKQENKNIRKDYKKLEQQYHQLDKQFHQLKDQYNQIETQLNQIYLEYKSMKDLVKRDIRKKTLKIKYQPTNIV